ncbi:hypothetical protein D3C73_1177580 [compost metagenome]
MYYNEEVYSQSARGLVHAGSPFFVRDGGLPSIISAYSPVLVLAADLFVHLSAPPGGQNKAF